MAQKRGLMKTFFMIIAGVLAMCASHAGDPGEFSSGSREILSNAPLAGTMNFSCGIKGEPGMQILFKDAAGKTVKGIRLDQKINFFYGWYAGNGTSVDLKKAPGENKIVLQFGKLGNLQIELNGNRIGSAYMSLKEVVSVHLVPLSGSELKISDVKWNGNADQPDQSFIVTNGKPGGAGKTIGELPAESGYEVSCDFQRTSYLEKGQQWYGFSISENAHKSIMLMGDGDRTMKVLGKNLLKSATYPDPVSISGKDHKWHKFKLTYDGDTYTVFIDEKEIIHFPCPALDSAKELSLNLIVNANDMEIKDLQIKAK